MNYIPMNFAVWEGTVINLAGKKLVDECQRLLAKCWTIGKSAELTALTIKQSKK